jgi:peroxiredoxin Q/BCP
MAKAKKSRKAKKTTRTKTKAGRARKRPARPALKRKKTAPARRKSVASARPARAAARAPDKLPDIEVTATGGQRFRLPDLRGRNVVLYFYPKDDTPGCTQESCDVRDNFADFGARDTVVFGVSRDSLESHERFKFKYSFPFDLISDPEEKLCRAFGVMQPKTLYGRKYIGVERSTFVFDRDGRLRRELRGVKVPGHVAELLMELDKL